MFFVKYQPYTGLNVLVVVRQYKYKIILKK